MRHVATQNTPVASDAIVRDVITHTPALVLQVRPFSKTSHIVTWLTPEQGRITTSVKGACRPKSAFLGQYDLFYTCDLLYYTRDHDHVHAARECTPVDRRDSLRSNWRAAAAAAYLVDLTARALPPGHPHPELYTALVWTLDQLALGHAPLNLVLRYEIIVLNSLGLLPNWTLCPTCHTEPSAWLRFSLPAGRFLCAHTPPPHPRETVLSLSHTTHRLFTRYMAPHRAALSTPASSNKNEPRTNLLLGLSRFLGIFITFHLDVSPNARRVAMELLYTHCTQG